MTRMPDTNTQVSDLPALIPTTLRCIAVASALCCAGLTQAQTAGPTTVTLYGLADVGITQVSGLKAGSVTQVASGIMEGSRWGMKGNEDLGGGYRAVFTLESRVELDTGSTTNKLISGTQLPDRLSSVAGLNLAGPATLLVDDATNRALIGAASGPGGLGTKLGVNLEGNVFDRQAFVGLVTPFGAFLAGRQYTPAFESIGTYDIMGTQSALAVGQIVAYPEATAIRASNALAYRIQQGGISGSLMYAAGEVAGDASKSRLLGMNGNYKTDLFSVGFGYNTKNDEAGNKSLTTGIVGASMNFGSSTVSTLVAKITDDNPSGLATFTLGTSAPAIAVRAAYINALKQDGTLFHIGYRYITGPSTISVAYNNFNDKRSVNADVSSYGVAYTYALSKRTDLNAVLVRYDNKNTAQVAPGGNGYIGGYTASAGTDSTGLALGIRHRF